MKTYTTRNDVVVLVSCTLVLVLGNATVDEGVVLTILVSHQRIPNVKQVLSVHAVRYVWKK